MGLFDDKTTDAYKRAAEAVQRGDADDRETALNDKMARGSGSDASRAQQAQKGTLRKG